MREELQTGPQHLCHLLQLPNKKVRSLGSSLPDGVLVPFRALVGQGQPLQ